jgi:polysaccharide biosynthesis protein PslH
MTNRNADRPRLLFLAQTLPYPPHGGVQIRTYNVLRLLSRAFDITALCFHRRSSHPNPEHVQASVLALRSLADIQAFPIPQEHSRTRLYRDHAASVMSLRPYTVYSYRSGEYAARLGELLDGEAFDLVHMDSLDLSTYLPELSELPVICAHHNVESALLRRRAANERSAVRRHYLALQAALLEREERRWMPRMALNTAVSEDDRRRLQDLAPAASLAVVPNGVDTSFFEPAQTRQTGIVFVGGYGWYPNRDALEFFAADILPHVRAAEPELRIQWVGRAPDATQAWYRDHHGIELTGYVEDIRPYVHSASCYVAPLRVGGGTRLKILDAWAMGKAVVSTSIGCEGLDAKDGDNILIRDDPSAFAAAVRLVLGDEDLRTRLGEGARRTAEERYDWDIIGRNMLAEYRKLIDHRPHRVSART